VLASLSLIEEVLDGHFDEPIHILVLAGRQLALDPPFGFRG
jgi:hypothetical protein